jgi:transcriptional regulator with XRE-family HTH domain
MTQEVATDTKQMVVMERLHPFMEKHDLSKKDIHNKTGVSPRTITRILEGNYRNYQDQILTKLYNLITLSPMSEEMENEVISNDQVEELKVENSELKKKVRMWKDIAHDQVEKLNNQIAISCGTKIYVKTTSEERTYTGVIYQQTPDFLMIEVYDKKSEHPYYYTLAKNDIKFIKTFYE